MSRNAVSTMRKSGRRLVRLFAATGRGFARAPLDWGWSVTAGVAVGTTLAYAEKEPIAGFFAGHGGGLATQLAKVVDVAGSGFSVLVLGLVVLVAGYAFRRDVLVEAALVLGAAGAWAWLFTSAGQFIFAERRPVDGGAMFWFAFGGHGVSGHAAAAALWLAPVRDIVTRRAGKPVRNTATAAALAWAALVGWSRMWLGMHYLWNVVLGLTLGFLAGRAASAASRADIPEPE